MDKRFFKLLGKVRHNVDLSSYNTMRISSTASYFVEVFSYGELVYICKESLRLGFPFVVIGGGSNIVFLKDVKDKLIIRNEFIKKEVKSETDNNILLMVSSGYPMSLLVKEGLEKGWEGLEYFAGLPGTVGGAVYMNAKWINPKVFFGNFIMEAELLGRDGSIRSVKRNYFKFKYDYSILQETNEVLLTVTLKFKKGDKNLLKRKAKEVILYRTKTQPKGVFTSGCFFRNISEEEREEKGLPTTSAGYLIDRAGLKGIKIGDFEVSTLHANFIVNHGSGRKEDLIKLIKLIKSKVKSKFGIELEEEVIVI